MPSHRADTPQLKRPRTNRTSGSSKRPSRRPGTSLSAPQVGIAGALGIATIAAPISGAMASPVPKVQVNHIQAAVAAPLAAFPGLPTTTGAGVKALRVVPATQLVVATPEKLAAPRTVVVSRASRDGERSVLPGCSGVAKATSAPNGEIPADELCTLWDSRHRLRADAAVALAKLNVAFRQNFGDDVCLTDSYRTIGEQVRLRAAKPGLAAPPGTSNHGWGMAVDMCDGVETGSGARFQWLRENASDYGWENPDWARSGGGGPYEPWHWEFVAAQ